jgi:hypothetical protein
MTLHVQCARGYLPAGRHPRGDAQTSYLECIVTNVFPSSHDHQAFFGSITLHCLGRNEPQSCTAARANVYRIVPGRTSTQRRNPSCCRAAVKSALPLAQWRSLGLERCIFPEWPGRIAQQPFVPWWHLQWLRVQQLEAQNRHGHMAQRSSLPFRPATGDTLLVGNSDCGTGRAFGGQRPERRYANICLGRF